MATSVTDLDSPGSNRTAVPLRYHTERLVRLEDGDVNRNRERTQGHQGAFHTRASGRKTAESWSQGKGNLLE